MHTSPPHARPQATWFFSSDTVWYMPAPLTLEQPSSLSDLRSTLRVETQRQLERNLTNSAKWLSQLLVSVPKTPSTAAAQGNTNSPLLPTASLGGDLFATSTPVGSRHLHSSQSRLDLPGIPQLASISQQHTRARSRDSLGSVGGDSSPGAAGPSGVTARRRGERVGRREMTDLAAAESEMEEDDSWQQEEEDEWAQKKKEWAELDEDEEDVYLMALAFERTHEHLRAAHALRECKGPKARWLRMYAKFLAGEKRAQEDSGELLGVKDKGVPNPFTQELLAEMSTWEPGFVERDGYLLYIKALLLLSLPPSSPSPFPNREGSDGVRHDLRLLAMETLLQAVKLEPYNWAIWLKLASCIDGPEELETTMSFLPPTFPTLFFYVHTTLEIHTASDALHDILDQLDALFPSCTLVMGLRGLIHYHVREFDEAVDYFSTLQKVEPYRVDDVDIYSNILYVSEKRAELALLAQEYIKMDRARPEVCCLVGNYYSLRRDHEKAIVYFRRALKLDRGYLSAWTLMGHEYVEIKNTNAAIASYRRAVDVNRKDYRAWYGMGQTYELLGEPLYSISYYQKAAALRPNDSRMWAALAACYEKVKRLPDAIKSFQRALVSSEPGEYETAIRIGRLYNQLGDSFAAAQYHRRALSEATKAGAPKTELSKLWLWLAKWEIKTEREARRKRRRAATNANGTNGASDVTASEEGDLDAAREWLEKAAEVMEDKEEALGLQKDLATLMLDRE